MCKRRDGSFSLRPICEVRDRRHTNPQHGFTLIELLFAVAIILIALAISLPTLPTYLRDYQLRNDARALAGQLSAARILAAANTKRALVSCNETTKTCQIELRGLNDSKYSAATGRQIALSSSDKFGPPNNVGAGSPTNPGSQITTGAAQCDNIVYNSRGLPIYDSTSGAATTACNTNTTTDGYWVLDYVSYINDGHGDAVAVVVDPSGKTNLYQWNSTSNSWSAIAD